MSNSAYKSQVLSFSYFNVIEAKPSFSKVPHASVSYLPFLSYLSE